MKRATFVVFMLLGLPLSAARIEIPFNAHPTELVPIIDVKINGRTTKFILDTGSKQTLVADNLTDGSAPGLSRFRNDGNGLEVQGRYWAGNLAVGSHEWRRRTIGIIDATRIRDYYGKDIGGLLGQDVLREFESVTIDNRRSVITFVEK